MSRYSYRPELETRVNYAFLPDERFTLVGNLTDYWVEGNTLYLRCGGPLIALTLLADDLARVRFAPTGAFAYKEPFSYALDTDRSWPYGTLSVEDAGAYLRVDTDRMSIRINKAPCRFAFYTADGLHLNSDTAGLGFAKTDTDTQVRCWKHLEGDEGFFGLGDKTFPINRRGHRYIFWNSDTYAFGPKQDPIYKSIPFFIGLHTGGEAAYGLFFDNSYRSSIDLGEASQSHYSFGAEGGELRYYFFAGPSAQTVLERFTELTGRTPLPPKWALGYHQSRWNYQDTGYVLWIAHEFRRRGIPLDAIHLDIAYMDGYRVFTWDRHAFEDPKQMNTYLHELGVRSVVIIDPGVKQDPGYFVYDEGIEQDLFADQPGGEPFVGNVWPGDCHWPDFTKPATRTWWGNLHQFFYDSGVSGFWNDMNEPAILGGADFPDDVVFDFDGRISDHREAHNVYGLLMARSTYDGARRLRPDERPFLLTRACFCGSQRYAAAWTGDNVSSWEHLKLSLTMCQSQSASGIAMSGPDIGGFAGQPSPELYIRWMQAGAFYPFMRTHYSKDEIDNQEPWSFGEEAEAICRTYIGLRYKLMPYIYTAFEKNERTGIPPMRPLMFDHQTDTATWETDDQFYFGSALMVAPVVEDGARSRSVYFPAGAWYDFWTHERIEGGQRLERPAPLETLPLFARAGRVIPLHPVMQYTGEFQPDTLVLRVYPGADGSGSVFIDEGQGFGYRNGNYHRLSFTLAQEENQLTITCSRDGDRPSPYTTYEWHVPSIESATVYADGQELETASTAELFAMSDASLHQEGPVLRVRTRTDIETLRLIF